MPRMDFQSSSGRDVDNWGKNIQAQESAVDKFREHLAAKGVRGKQDYNTLLRFLRARDYDLDKSTIMYTSHLKWREENSVDTILEDFEFEERDEYLKAYPMGYYNTDRIGRPLTIQHLGRINPKRIKEVTTPERLLKFHVQEYERLMKHIMPACSKLHGRHIDKTFVIMDAKGVTLAMMTGDVRKTVSAISGVMQDHYPETLGKTFIINAPFVFKAVWAIVKPMLAPNTVKKVTMLGKDYLEELTRHVDPACLPDYMGGTCSSTLLEDPGPWNHMQPETAEPTSPSMATTESSESNHPTEEPSLEREPVRRNQSTDAQAPRASLPSQAASVVDRLHPVLGVVGHGIGGMIYIGVLVGVFIIGMFAILNDYIRRRIQKLKEARTRRRMRASTSSEGPEGVFDDDSSQT